MSAALSGFKLPKPEAAELNEGKEAVAEAAALAVGIDLSDRRALNNFNRLRRSDKVDGHIHRIVVFGLYGVAVCVAGMFLVIVWHTVAAEWLRFLTPPQISELYKFLFSGVVGGGVTGLSKKYLGGTQPKDD